jgi:DNA-binding transcriptional MerR regulator
LTLPQGQTPIVTVVGTAEHEDLLTIGRFARLTGLTTKALRHYDRIGLLRPAVVDDTNGYRRYRLDQIADARLVKRLRHVELPLEEIEHLLRTAGDPRDALRAHRRRMEARIIRLQRQLDDLDHIIDEGTWHAMTSAKTDTDLADEAHRDLGKALFNRTWALLEKEQRTPDEDAEMIHTAHASTFHWLRGGAPINAVRGEWQCARVYAVLGRAEPALFHARRVLAGCQQQGIGDFDLAFAYEALARAHAVADDFDESARWAELAGQASAEIADPEDREIVLSDLETIPRRSA